MHNMNIIIKHLVPWIIASYIVLYFGDAISHELFPIIVIGIIFTIFVYYITQQMIRYTIIPLAGAAIGTIAYMLINGML